jgi:hypothetical protein
MQVVLLGSFFDMGKRERPQKSPLTSRGGVTSFLSPKNSSATSGPLFLGWELLKRAAEVLVSQAKASPGLSTVPQRVPHIRYMLSGAGGHLDWSWLAAVH